jgi:hypothetical protein
MTARQPIRPSSDAVPQPGAIGDEEMSTKPDFRSLTGTSTSIAELREGYGPGCQPHYIQVLNVAEHQGRYEPGVLLGVDGMVAEVQLNGSSQVCRVGTLWPDRLARVAMSNVDRDVNGRPMVRWNRRARVLQLRDAEDGAYPSFNVVDLDAEPEYLAAWERLPAERNSTVGRPCFECGESFDWDDMDEVEQHLHETGLPGRLYRAAEKRRKGAVSGPGATSRSSGSGKGGANRPGGGHGAPRSGPRDG